MLEEMGKIDQEICGEHNQTSPIKEFVQQTTLHGIRNATASNSSLLRRFLWFVAFTSACGYLTFQLVTLALDFYSYPYKTVSRIVPKTSNVFPSIMICNMNYFDSKMINFSSELRTIYRAKNGDTCSGYSNLTMEDLRQTEPYKSILKRKYLELIDSASPNINKTLLWCVFDGVMRNCDHYIKYLNTPNGRCFIFNEDPLNPRITSRPGNSGGFFAFLRVDLSEYTYSELNSVGFKVIIDSRLDSPDVEGSGLLISPGFFNEIRLTEHHFEFLPAPHNSYGGATCSPYKPTQGIQTGNRPPGPCVKVKANMAARDKCGCDWTDCTLDSFLTCFKPEFDKFFENAMKTDRAGCDVPCKMVTYIPTKSSTLYPVPDANGDLVRLAKDENSSNTKYLILNIFFEDFMIRDNKHVPEYDHLSMIGILGGNVGLFLGASLLTLGEFTEVITLILIRAAERFHQLVKLRKLYTDNADRQKQDKQIFKDKAQEAAR